MIPYVIVFIVAVAVASAVDGQQLATKKCCRWNADRQQVERFSVALFLHTHYRSLCLNL